VKRSKSKLRNSSLLVERLECRRLLSASPNRVDFTQNTQRNERPDAFIERAGRGQNHDSQEQRDNAGTKNERSNLQNQNAKQYRPESDRNNQRGRKSNQDRNQTLVRDSSPVFNSLNSSPVSRLGLPFNDNIPSSNAVPNLSDFRVFNPSPEFDVTPPQITTKLPQLSELRQQPTAPTRPPLEATVTREVQTTQPSRTTPNPATPPASDRTVTSPFASDTASRNFDEAFAIAAQSITSFNFDSQDDEVAELQIAPMANIEAYGGMVDLSQIPELIDTLPDTIDETVPLFHVEDAEEPQEHGASDNVDLEMSDDSTTGRQRNNEIDVEAGTTAAQQPAKAEPTETATDELFADDQSRDLFGGEIDMPETLPSHDEAKSTVSFESIVPAAPRIDQIMSQAPMLELGDDTNHASNEESQPSEPISINLWAGLPMAMLCVPIASMRASKHNQTQQKQQRKNARKDRYSS